MTTKIDFETLTPEQTAALLNHLLELDQARLAGNNKLLHALASHPECTNGLADILNGWSAEATLIGEESDAEIVRIVVGAPAQSSMN